MAKNKTAEKRSYQAAVADARYLFRRAFRMVDEEARRLGLDSLENQLLIQLRGAPDVTRSVTELSERLDIPLGLVSRLAGQLEQRSLVTRSRSLEDGRVTLVGATAEGERLVEAVAVKSRRRFSGLQEDLSPARRTAALRVWMNNFGVELKE